MPHILDIIKNKLERIERLHKIQTSETALDEANDLLKDQKSAILEIRKTKGFRIIVEHEQGMVDRCLDLLAEKDLPDKTRVNTQITYAVSIERLRFYMTMVETTARESDPEGDE